MVLFSWYLAMSVAVALFDVARSEEYDKFMECIEYQACVDSEGYESLMRCYSKLSQTDADFLLDILSEDLKTERDIKKIIKAGCKDPEKGKAAFNRYYDERQKFDKENPKNGADRGRYDAGECINDLQNDCDFKEEFAGVNVFD